MDFTKFFDAIQIPVRAFALRGQEVFVRQLTSLELQESLVTAKKWAEERAREMKAKGLDRIEGFTAGDEASSELVKKYGIDTIAINSKLQAVMALSDSGGKPITKDSDTLKRMTMGEGSLIESEVRTILKLSAELAKESESDEATEETEKNSEASAS